MAAQSSEVSPMPKLGASVEFGGRTSPGIADKEGYIYHLSPKEKREVDMAMLHFKGLSLPPWCHAKHGYC
jgi:hypothetical protein